MKRNLYIVGCCVLLVVSLLFTGCFGTQQESQNQGNSSTENVSEKVDEPIKVVEKEVVGGKLQYPVLNLGNKAVSEAINADIDAFVEKEKSVDGGDIVRHSMEYSTMFDDDNVIAFLFTQSIEYKGAAHPETKVDTLVYDKKSGKQKMLSDYVDISLPEVLQIANEEYYGVKGGKRNHTPQFTPTKMPKDFYPDKEGNIWIVFQRYELGPGVEGPSAVKIPASRVKK